MDPLDPLQERTPFRLGPYWVRERLGQGTGSDRFLARYRHRGDETEPVLLRVMSGWLHDQHPQRYAEIQAYLALARHPNLPRLVHAGVVEQRACYSVAYLPGVNLESLLFRQPRPPVAFAAYLGMKVARALMHLHAAALVHQTVAACHVRLTFRGECVLLGLAPPAMLGDDDVTPQVHPLPGREQFAFHSPEQIRGLPLDARSDLYSLGAVLWEAVSGRRLVESEGSLPDLLQRALQPAPDVRRVAPDTPDALADLIAQLLHPDPTLRPASAEAVHARLEPLARLHGSAFGPLQLIEVLRTHFPAEHAVEMGRAS